MPPAEGSSPAARRAWLASRSDAELRDWISDVAARQRITADEAEKLAALAGVPVPEVMASPFSLRAVAMAVAEGVSHAQLWTRAPVAWPEVVDEHVADSRHGIWDAGTLRTGKYQGFLQDEPLAVYNPMHMAKWTPHEMLHRICGTMGGQGVSRWAHYLGARLNELVPVVLWYGLDEVLRGEDASGFDRARASARPWVADTECVWWQTEGSQGAEATGRSVQWLRHGLAHFGREWDALQRERDGEGRVSVPWDGLDASSDALAYVRRHGDRLTERATLRLHERLPRDVSRLYREVSALADRVESVLDGLLFGTVEVDAAQAASRRDARVLWDWLQRGAQQGWTVFRPWFPLLDEACVAMQGAWEGAAPLALEAWWTRLQAAARGSIGLELALRNGCSWAHPAAVDRETLGFGVSSLAPRLWDGLPRAGRASVLDALLEGLPRAGRRPMAAQLPAAVDSLGHAGASSLLSLELVVAACRPVVDDPVALHEAAEAWDLPGAVLVARPGWQALSFAGPVVSWHQGGAWWKRSRAEAAGSMSWLLVGWDRDGVVMLEVSEGVWGWWASLMARGTSWWGVPEAMSALAAALMDEAVAAGEDAEETAQEWLEVLADGGAVCVVTLPEAPGRKTDRED